MSHIGMIVPIVINGSERSVFEQLQDKGFNSDILESLNLKYAGTQIDVRFEFTKDGYILHFDKPN